MTQENRKTDDGLSDAEIKAVGRITIGCMTAIAAVLACLIVVGIIEIVKSIF